MAGCPRGRAAARRSGRLIAVASPTEDAARAERRRSERRPRNAAIARRRLVALVAVAVLAAVDREDGPGPGSGPSAESEPECPAEVAADPRRLVGQMLIVRMEATATDGMRRALRRGEIGGVVLFPPAGTGQGELRREIQALRDAAAEAGAPAPLVMVDQEGGEVKRLPALPPDRPPVRIAGQPARCGGLGSPSRW